MPTLHREILPYSLIGNHMGLSAIWKEKMHGNRSVITQDETKCYLGLL